MKTVYILYIIVDTELLIRDKHSPDPYTDNRDVLYPLEESDSKDSLLLKVPEYLYRGELTILEVYKS